MVVPAECKVAPVHGLVALIAERDQVPRFVRPAMTSILDVMHVQVLAQSTTATFPAITLQNALHESMVCLSRKS